MTTRPELQQILAVWQDRLRLGYWDIKLSDTKPDAEKVEAEIHVHEDYDQASIRLRDGWEEWDEEMANRVIVHELLHCFERGTKQAVWALEGVVPQAAALLTIERYRHESENMIEALSIVLVQLVGFA